MKHANILLSTALLALSGCVHPKPILATHGWVREQASATTTSLEGIVCDQTGYQREGVLVQLLTPDGRYRIGSSQTDANGRFHFRSHANKAYILRFSLNGFNDLDLTVETSANVKQPLQVTLHISN